jgi:hypothetical protein
MKASPKNNRCRLEVDSVLGDVGRLFEWIELDIDKLELVHQADSA